MSNLRLIARLDIKGPNLIKGVRFEGLRVLGDPQQYAKRYYDEGIDEIIYMDMVASLYGRNSLHDIVSYTAKNIFIPLTAGGGIRSVEDVRNLLRIGADKVAINTAAVRRPQLIREVSLRFGSQCMVLSIEAKKNGNDSWEAYTDCGREHSGKDALEWAKEGAALGAGEILLTSVDQDGTQQGFDIDLIRAVTEAVTIPVIASGGMGNLRHLIDIATKTNVSAVAMAHVLHYGKHRIPEIRNEALNVDLPVRFRTTL